MAGEILSGGFTIAFTGYGALWKKLRRAAHEGFHSRVSSSYEPIQETEAATLVKCMIERPDSWEYNLQRSVLSEIRDRGGLMKVFFQMRCFDRPEGHIWVARTRFDKGPHRRSNQRFREPHRPSRVTRCFSRRHISLHDQATELDRKLEA
jgi:hypothetical protein